MYARVLKVEPFSLSESIISELMDLDFSTILSMHCDGMDGPAAEKKRRRSWKVYDLPDSRTDGSLSVIKNHFFSVTTTAVIFAEDKKQLDENTELFQSLLVHYCTDLEILYSPHLQEAVFLQVFYVGSADIWCLTMSPPQDFFFQNDPCGSLF